jgi:hypothetical protein
MRWSVGLKKGHCAQVDTGRAAVARAVPVEGDRETTSFLS